MSSSQQQYPSSGSTAQPTNVYTAGLPAPPRILIPPPTLHSEVRNFEHLRLHNSNTGTLNGSQFNNNGDSDQSLDYMLTPPGSLMTQTTLQDWKYESRREAQQILPHLWLGPLSAAKNTTFLAAKNITLLLAVRSSMTAKAKLLVNQLPGIRYESIDVSGNQELIAQFQRATDIIDEHYLQGLPPRIRQALTPPLSGRELYAFQKRYPAENPGELLPQGGTTLLFCESGNERSASVAAAYVMQHLSRSAVQAIQIVQSRRFCVCFDDPMKWLLSSYEPIWMARRQAARQNGMVYAGAGHGSGQYGSTRGISLSRGTNKRRLEEYEEEYEDASSHKAQSHAPFSDGDVDANEGDMEMT
ncbi:phosphatases II [Choiromyces venosus 120613-1]|uniref:Phosphatases II n=1 Tax=Choiromyces venosus 120613-1 TaxID=1336337 RepID=A0A3N4JSA0_9PEZI|nr:phosphatases II [Choiromyces venosus 120613-1]